MNLPRLTLFMLMSVDGKISTGSSDDRDVDIDFPKIKGVSEGLCQYYDFEQSTDLHSLNTGRVFAKMGINEASSVSKTPVSFIVLDNSHLTRKGVMNLLDKSQNLYIVTNNKAHPAYGLLDRDNLIVLNYEGDLDFTGMFSKLRNKYGIESITIQSGGELNSHILRDGLIDYLSLFVAPVLIGGRDTSTLVDGGSLISESDLKYIRTMTLDKIEKLDSSYIYLRYKLNSYG